MEGLIARWYANLTKKALDDFRALARQIKQQLPPNADVLEVAPGLGISRSSWPGSATIASLVSTSARHSLKSRKGTPPKPAFRSISATGTLRE